MDIETTRSYLPNEVADTQDDLVDTALDAIEHRTALRDLLQVARIAAGALETRGMRATGMRLRALCNKVAKHTT